jgi:hypothetical protein
MRAIVIYESEFGATRRIAEAVASGLASHVLTELRNVRELLLEHPPWRPQPGDILVVGAPTHARGLPRPITRASALDWPKKPGSTLTLEPRALANGVREWLADADLQRTRVAAFATRAFAARILTGSAASAIARLAQRRGAELIARPKSFVVQPQGGVSKDELATARDWGRALSVEITTGRDIV